MDLLATPPSAPPETRPAPSTMAAPSTTGGALGENPVMQALEGWRRSQSATPAYTHTALATFRSCPRRYWLAYELGCRPARSPLPLAFGSAFHAGREILRSRGTLDAACNAAAGKVFEPFAREAVLRLLCGYEWIYRDDDTEPQWVEQEFAVELAGIVIKGKIDELARLPDGRLAVVECKTGKQIAEAYWTRLRRDQQISLYMIAARRLGFPVDTVIYDVVRKPSLEPLRRNSRRLSDETPSEYGERIKADIAERPKHYYIRREIPRLDSDLELVEAEIAEQVRAIRADYRYRNSETCERCQFNDAICDLDDADIQAGNLPGGWTLNENKHPELNNDDRTMGTAGGAAAQGIAADGTD